MDLIDSPCIQFENDKQAALSSLWEFATQYKCLSLLLLVPGYDLLNIPSFNIECPDYDLFKMDYLKNLRAGP
jgi:hypothetical protein